MVIGLDLDLFFAFSILYNYVRGPDMRDSLFTDRNCRMHCIRFPYILIQLLDTTLGRGNERE